MRTRIERAIPYLLFGLAMNLLVVSILAVPQDAFADGGTGCSSCEAVCSGNSDPTTCGQCIAQNCCNGDPTCQANDCQAIYGTSSNNTTLCMAPDESAFDCAKRCTPCTATVCSLFTLGCCTDCTGPTPSLTTLCKTDNWCNCFDSQPNYQFPQCACRNNLPSN